jgi:hypothetical protein
MDPYKKRTRVVKFQCRYDLQVLKCSSSWFIYNAVMSLLGTGSARCRIYGVKIKYKERVVWYIFYTIIMI